MAHRDENLVKKASKGVFWSGMERFSVQGIQILITIVLGNILIPEDFGLIASVTIFIAVSQTFIDSGFSNALIQNKDRKESDFSTIFWFNIVVALLIYLLLFFSSPLITRLYGDPIYTPVIRWLSLNFVLFALMVVQKAKLTISLDFKTQAKASIIAVVIGGVCGIVVAVLGYGVWAIVVQQLTTNSIQALLLWFYSDWSPKFLFDVKAFRKMVPFGSKLLLTGLLNTTYNNIYNSIIAKRFSAADAGYFNQGSKFSQFASTNLSSIVTRAVFPILSDMQDDDRKLRSSFISYLSISAYIIFPLMIGVIILADPFIGSIYPDGRWAQAVPYLQILSLAYMWYPLIGINSLILMVKGRTDLNLRSEIIKKIVGFSTLFISLPFGLKYITYGVVLYNLIDILISIFFAKKVIPAGIIAQVKAVAPALIISLIMGVVIYFIAPLFDLQILKLLIGTTTGAVVYLLLLYIFRPKDLALIVKLIKAIL